MRDMIRRLGSAANGATAVEYGLICALIVVAAIGVFTMLAEETIEMWSDVARNVLTRS